MTVANNDVVRADVIGDWDTNTEIVSSYQFQLISGGPLANADALDDLADIFEDIWDIIKALYNVSMKIRRLKGRIVPSGTLIGEYTWGTPLQGTTASDISSTTVTAPISFLTSVPRVILRKSLGPMLENGITAYGELSGTSLTILGNLGTFLLADRTEVNGVWRYGYYSPKITAFIAPDSAVYSSAPGTMARRRLGRGA